jgi:hypothetical protein
VCSRRSAGVELRRSGARRGLAAPGARDAWTVRDARLDRALACRRARSASADFDAALGQLAAAEPDALDGLARFLAGEHTWLASGELAVVTATTDPACFAQILALATRRVVSVVWIDAASFAGRPTRAEPGLLRLAGHGIPAAVVRQGDDLAAELSGRAMQAVAHA